MTSSVDRRALEAASLADAIALGIAGSGARLLNRNCSVTINNQTRNAWGYGATANIHYPTTAVACEIISSSAADAAAGTGARTVYVEGLNASFALISETAILNGTNAVALTNSYYRILDVRVLTAGSGTLNAGRIDVRKVSGSNVMGSVQASYSRMDSLSYTCPAGRRAFVVRASLEPNFSDLVYTDATTAVTQVPHELILYRYSSGVYFIEGRLATRRVPVQREWGMALPLIAGEDLDVTIKTTGASLPFDGYLQILELPA